MKFEEFCKAHDERVARFRMIKKIEIDKEKSRRKAVEQKREKVIEINRLRKKMLGSEG